MEFRLGLRLIQPMLQGEFLHLGGCEKEGEIIAGEWAKFLGLRQAGKYLFSFTTKFRGKKISAVPPIAIQLHQQRLDPPLGFLNG